VLIASCIVPFSVCIFLFASNHRIPQYYVQYKVRDWNECITLRLNELTFAIMNNQINAGSSAPSLPSSLSSLYSLLPYDSKQLFNRAFMFLWSYLHPKASYLHSGGVLYYYYIADLLRVRYDLTASELALLSYLYGVSNKGADVIHSNVIYSGSLLPHICRSSKANALSILHKRGFIVRLNRNPASPYLQRSISCRREFIQMSAKGVSVITDMNRDLYKLLRDSSLNDIIGANK